MTTPRWPCALPGLLGLLGSAAVAACANELVAEDLRPDAATPVDSAPDTVAQVRSDARAPIDARAVADARLTTGPYVTFEIDGVLHDDSFVAEGRVVALGLATVSIDGKAGDGADDDSISIVAFGVPPGEGSYACKANAQLTVVLDRETLTAATCVIDVTDVGEEGERMVGTFSASLAERGVQLENGRFSVVRQP